MIRRIISLSLVFVMTVLLFSVNVSAAETTGILYECDFEGLSGWAGLNPDTGELVRNADVGDWKIGDINNEEFDWDTSYSAIDNGEVTVKSVPSTTYQKGLGSARYSFDTSLKWPSNFAVSFDVCKISGGNLYMGAYMNEYYLGQLGTLPGSVTPGTWYTYVYQIKGNKGSVYRKVRGSNSYEAVLLDGSLGNPIAGRSSIFYLYVAIGAAEWKFDNVSVFAGTYPNLETSGINITDNAYGGKSIAATVELSSADIPPTTPASVLPILVVFDKKGKIMGMVNTSQTLKYGHGNVYDESAGLKIDFSAEEFAKLDGGTAELYLWYSLDGLDPIMTPYKVDISTN